MSSVCVPASLHMVLSHTAWHFTVYQGETWVNFIFVHPHSIPKRGQKMSLFHKAYLSFYKLTLRCRDGCAALCKVTQLGHGLANTQLNRV